jgi:hypothetical protein
VRKRGVLTGVLWMVLQKVCWKVAEIGALVGWLEDAGWQDADCEARVVAGCCIRAERELNRGAGGSCLEKLGIMD